MRDVCSFLFGPVSRDSKFPEIILPSGFLYFMEERKGESGGRKEGMDRGRDKGREAGRQSKCSLDIC